MSRKTAATIDLSALAHNFVDVAKRNPSSRHLAVIKADAYGHGAVQVAQALHGKADGLAVAFVDEAQQLRDAGIDTFIVLLEGVFSKEELAWAAQHNTAVVFHTEEQFEWLMALPKPHPAIWLKVDTGMHRLGFLPNEIPSVIERFQSLFDDNTVLFSHMACADEMHSPHAANQLQLLQKMNADLTLPVSVANSAGIISWPDAQGAWNRIGIAMYGGDCGNPDFTPLSVMSLRAPVIGLRTIPSGDSVGYGANWTAQRPTRIATVAIGYADGYPRHAPNGTPAWLNDHRIELVGRVSMDMVTFDVTDVESISIGDQVELWGKHQSITEVAETIGTIDYELMTRLSVRVPRLYR